jgi:hypothetical protein
MPEPYPFPDGEEPQDSDLLLWIFWISLWMAVGGEIALFMLADVGSRSTQVAGSLHRMTTVQTATLIGIALTMTTLSAVVFWKRLAGGGMATALISWMLGKSVAITGLVAFQLAGSHVYFWPFLGVFAGVMLVMNPTQFEAPERPSSPRG